LVSGFGWDSIFFVLKLFSFESRFSFMVLTKFCMLKCKHLRVKVRAPKAAMMGGES
jgi:hypothetical protein